MSRWSMKHDRELIRLAGAKLSVAQITTSMKAPPATVVKAAKKLGIYLGPIAKPIGRPKAKEK